ILHEAIRRIDKRRSNGKRRHVDRQEAEEGLLALQGPGQEARRSSFWPSSGERGARVRMSRNVPGHRGGNGGQIIDGGFLVLRRGRRESSDRRRCLAPRLLRGQLSEPNQTGVDLLGALPARPFSPARRDGRPKIINRPLESQPFPRSHRFRAAVNQRHNSLVGQFEQSRRWGSWIRHVRRSPTGGNKENGEYNGLVRSLGFLSSLL